MTVAMRFRAVIYLVAAVFVVWLWFYMRSDAVRIRRVFDDVARLAHRDPSETVMEGSVRARAIAAYLAEGCRCIVPEYGVRAAVSRANASGAVLTGRNAVPTLRVRFGDLQIVSEDGVALVTGEVDFTGSDPAFELVPPYVRPFEAELKETDGRWLFTRLALPDL